MLNTRFSFFGQSAGHDVGFDQIDIDAPENGTNVPHDALAPKAAMTRPGYIYIYLSNETKQSEVYFDDLLITHTHSPVVQKDDYYPFGLSIAGLSAKKENSFGNRWTFQGQERQDAHDLGWYGFKWRNHQPELGRFFNIDPLSEKYTYNSTFAFSENRVVDGIELEGLEFFGTSSNFLSGVSNWYQTQQLSATMYGGYGNYMMASAWNFFDNNFNMARPMGNLMLDVKQLGEFNLAYENGETYHQYLPGDGFLNIRELSYQYDKLNLNANIVRDFGDMAKVQGNWFGVLSGAQQSALSSSFTNNMAMNRWIIGGEAYDDIFLYRALNSADAVSISQGNGIWAKAPFGDWTLEQHLIHGSSSKSWLNNPWIATTTDINIAKSFNSGNGLIRINLAKLPPSSIQEGWLSLPRSSTGYHYSIWQQEVSVFKHIHQSAISIIE